MNKEMLCAWECDACITWFFTDYEYTPEYCPDCGESNGFTRNRQRHVIEFARGEEYWERETAQVQEGEAK